MSKVKNAREKWADQYVSAMLELEPRCTADDVDEEAWELAATHGQEDPATVARQKVFPDGKPHTEYILGVNTPAWMKPGAEVPAGWRYESGAWRND